MIQIKKLPALVLILTGFGAMAQPKKAPKMAPMFAEGYYVSTKGDTVRGSIQTNPDDETDMYRQFFFLKPGGGKAMAVNPKKAKAYGFDNKHYVQISNGEEDIFVERLAQGRINFFEYRFNGKIDGDPAIESVYYAQDTRAEGADAALKDVRKISTKFYKKDLKPYLKEQPMIWSDLDKFTFDKNAIVRAINEFNKYYIITSN